MIKTGDTADCKGARRGYRFANPEGRGLVDGLGDHVLVTVASTAAVLLALPLVLRVILALRHASQITGRCWF